MAITLFCKSRISLIGSKIINANNRTLYSTMPLISISDYLWMSADPPKWLTFTLTESIYLPITENQRAVHCRSTKTTSSYNNKC